ncbi:MAG TPA: glycosyltransferase family 2 protein [Kiritimatiellia bacterium]
MVRVLIGIPTYKRPQFVMQAVRSVIAQGFDDWQAIVSDNPSPGDIGRRIRADVESLGEPRVSFHQQDTNGGEYGQGRYFFAQARALGCEYLTILHDDDTLEPGYLAAAVEALDRNRDMSYFVCNAHVMNAEGERSDELTLALDRRQQRIGASDGPFDVLSRHMASGFTPICATFFRMSALEDSGFVDPDIEGNVPFENNIFLRLGERGAKAWFDSRRLISFRMHLQQLRNTEYLNNEQIVRNSIRVFERRHFEGENERRRRQCLGRLHRIEAMHKANSGDYAAARAAAMRALRASPTSGSTWLVAAGTHLAPYLVRSAASAWLRGAGTTVARSWKV